jgi:hypothetical protein
MSAQFEDSEVLYRRAAADCHAIADDMDPDDCMRRPFRLVAQDLERRLDEQDLPSRSGMAQVVPTSEPPMSDWWEKSVTLCEWHETDAFREMHESFRDVAGLSDNTREWLADGGVDLARAAQMTDAELLSVSRVGRVTVGKLRRFFAEREQYEEEAA